MFHVKHPLSLKQVLEFVSHTGIIVSPEAQSKLDLYAQLIQNWAKRQNLISHGDRQHINERHFLPSFFLLSRLNPSHGSRLLDIGSGTGFPAVVLKIVHPELVVTAIDSSRKKCLFLKEVDERLRLKLNVVNQRIEVFNTQNTIEFDYATSRAVTNLKDLWDWVQPVLKSSGRLIALKGGEINRDVQALKTQGVNCGIYRVDTLWTNFSPYLNGKFLVELEIGHDRK